MKAKKILKKLKQMINSLIKNVKAVFGKVQPSDPPMPTNKLKDSSEKENSGQVEPTNPPMPTKP